MKKTLTILIPSRNRPQQVLRALKSLEKLHLDDFVLRVVISDNSDIPYQKMSSPLQLLALRPPSRFVMPLHWDWMIDQVESDYFTILTDRSILLPENFSEALSRIDSADADLIAYSFAGYGIHYFPYFVGGLGYTNSSYDLSSSSIMDDARKSHYWAAFPRALNCIFSARAVRSLKDKFGNVFDGVSPDVNFAFRYLSIFDHFLYLDKPVFLSVSSNDSNGRASLRGEMTELQTWALNESKMRLSRFDGLPNIADLPLAINSISHEMADIHGLDGFSLDCFYDRVEKEKARFEGKSVNGARFLLNKISRPFTVIKSDDFAMSLASTCFNTSHLNKKYIFE
jgi:hypothetical protein